MIKYTCTLCSQVWTKSKPPRLGKDICRCACHHWTKEEYSAEDLLKRPISQLTDIEISEIINELILEQMARLNR